MQKIINFDEIHFERRNMSKQRIIKINEQQYRQLIGEELHYPMFLETIKQDLFVKIFNLVKKNLKYLRIKNSWMITDEFFPKKENKYFDVIYLDITIKKSDCNILDLRNYKGFYYADSGIDDNRKIILPKLILTIPINFNVDENEIVNKSVLRTIISHEIGHLYDDWIGMINGNEQLSLRKKTSDIGKLMNISNNIKDNKYLNDIAFLAYLAHNTEKKSFVSQTFHELKTVGCDRFNYKEKYKQLTSYQNYYKTYVDVNNFVKNASDEDIVEISKLIDKEHLDIGIPKLIKNNIQGFKQKLLLFNEKLYTDFVKRLGGVIVLYLENHSLTENIIIMPYVK